MVVMAAAKITPEDLYGAVHDIGSELDAPIRSEVLKVLVDLHAIEIRPDD